MPSLPKKDQSRALRARTGPGREGILPSTRAARRVYLKGTSPQPVGFRTARTRPAGSAAPLTGPSEGRQNAFPPKARKGALTGGL